MDDRSVIALALDNHDPYDQFAWVQSWRFAICEVLLFDHDVLVGGYNPGCATEAEDSFEVADLRYTLASEEAMLYALKIFDRFRVWLGLAGEDY